MKIKSQILTRAREVLRIELEALSLELKNLGEDFFAATLLLFERSAKGGKIVVVGMGKSGHIARKIAATLSSTGSPAIFLHPAEGLHGDLGLIHRADTVLILSASGETEEIKQFLPAVSACGVPIIAMTANRHSRLAKAAKRVLHLHFTREACPHNLAPTASTTAMLALGDAVAMALMELKNFKPQDFAKFHPAGTLGKRLNLKVKDLMRSGSDCPRVPPHASVEEALLTMTATRAGATAIVDSKNALLGFFTDGDLRRCLQKDSQILRRKINAVMTQNPLTLNDADSLQTALDLFRTRSVDNVPVVNRQKKLVGLLDERDLLQEGIA